MRIDMKTKSISLPAAPGRPKKITGTRFAAILGLNPWCTPFEVWCDMTKTYSEPFEETIYTNAGKVIEPKVIAYLDRRYFFGKGLLKDPDTWFGKTKEQLRYDHFHDEPIFGGMWDARTANTVFEIKTSKRAEDWYRNGEFTPPEYYKLQAALYAHLLKLDTFYLTLTLLNDPDYEHPEAIVLTPANTMIKKFSLSAEYPDFADKMDYCLCWHDNYIRGAQSPEWDDKRDKDILKALTTAHVPVSGNSEQDIVSELIAQIEPLLTRIEEVAAQVSEDEKRLDALKKQLKEELEGRMGDTDKRIEATGSIYEFEVARASAGGIDTAKLKEDGLYDLYKKTGTTTKFVCRRKVS